MRMLLFLVLACRRDPPPIPEPLDEADTDTDVDSDTDADTDTDTDPTLPSAEWTKGPDLPPCTPSAGNPDRVALSGVVLTPTGAVAGSVVLDRVSGTVACVGASCDTAGLTVVCTGGVISPALIDTHDHTQYNVLAPWQHDGLFVDRYDWQGDFDYYEYRTSYDEMDDAYVCEIVKWAELRQIVGGATSVVGTSGDECIEGIGRDLDTDPDGHGIDDYYLRFSSQQVGFYDSLEAADRADDLATGYNDVFLDHVAEGIDGNVRDEIEHMFDIGMVGPGNVYVHATDATVEQLAEMASTSTGIVWSPRSNLDLYADTTKADLAIRLGVPLAIGPDWTWSGSNRLSAELDCAHDWLLARGSDITDVDLWEMATLDASVLLGLQGQLGMLVPGAKADVAVFAWSDEPYRAIIEAGYEDVLLVTIDGDARYGDPALVDGLEANPAWCESVTACSAPRTLCVAEADDGTDAVTYAELEATLSTALLATPMPTGLEYAGELYPLWACDEVRPSCDPRVADADDLDGDGIVDDADNCPAAYDPDQRDHEGDGVGDVCDACPLTAAATCTHNPDDMDDDGLANDVDGCPWVADDPGSPDADGDGHPDACDVCPDVPNPGALGCPATIRSVRDPNHPDHPSDGLRVTIAGVVVTAVGPFGLFVQDPSEADYGALYAYGASGASVGDEVEVTGDYAEFFGFTQLEDASVTVTGTLPVPAPIHVDPCDIGTGGPDGERYESMLVEVGPTTVSNANPDDPDDYDEWEVAGCLRIDDALCPDCWADQPAVGTAYDAIVGPLNYSFGDTKVYPRTAADSPMTALDQVLAIARAHGLEPSHPLEGAVVDVGTDDPSLEDLRHLAFATIDYPTSMDLDQAVFVEDDGGSGGASLELGGAGLRARERRPGPFVVWYAIADASWFVRPGTELHQEALRRGATYYLPGLTIPMLPRSLSEGLVSLLPDVDRRALVFRMRVSAEGASLGCDVLRAVIRSRCKTSYAAVQAWVDGGPAPSADPGVMESLRALGRVGEARLRDAEGRGVVRVRRMEVAVDVADTRFVALRDPRSRVEMWNEQISLLANAEGAEALERRSADPTVQAIYRVMSPPSAEDLAGLAGRIRAIAAVHGRSEVWDPSSEALADWLQQLPDDAVGRAIHRQVLLVGGRASFVAEPAVHAGVGAEVYARFTAPMREIVGVFLHGELTQILEGSDPTRIAADEALRVEVIAAASRSRGLQRDLDHAVNERVLDQLFAEDGRTWTATVMGFGRGKVHLLLDDPPIDVKWYVPGLRVDDDGVRMLPDGVRIGDSVTVKIAGRDAERRRWLLDVR